MAVVCRIEWILKWGVSRTLAQGHCNRNWYTLELVKLGLGLLQNISNDTQKASKRAEEIAKEREYISKEETERQQNEEKIMRNNNKITTREEWKEFKKKRKLAISTKKKNERGSETNEEMSRKLKEMEGMKEKIFRK